MSLWWFAAAVDAPTKVLSYPWLFPGLIHAVPRGGTEIRVLWAAMGVLAARARGAGLLQFAIVHRAARCRWSSCSPILGASGAAHALLGPKAPGDTERDWTNARSGTRPACCVLLRCTSAINPVNVKKTLLLTEHG